MNKAFDNDKYKKLQKQAILDRIAKFDRLYFEVGGKLFDDYHASRVLPGFEPDVKMQILTELKNELEIIFCINANQIIEGKFRGDNNLSYADDVLRLANLMKNKKISVLGIVITFYSENDIIKSFEKKCEEQGFKTYKSYFIKNYPNDIDLILSKDGFGKNDYIVTSKKLILVSAPGANGGKMETCLSQLYNDKIHGISSGYAKYETFPVWNLPIEHLTNVAYEMATADLGDENLIDPYYKNVYGKEVVNYNRDIDSFPILSKILNQINGKEVYTSPTEMGINQVGFAIEKDIEIQKASFEEIQRRHEKHKLLFAENKFSEKSMNRSDEIFEKASKIYEKL